MQPAQPPAARIELDSLHASRRIYQPNRGPKNAVRRAGGRGSGCGGERRAGSRLASADQKATKASLLAIRRTAKA
jgi:hypothetical protein